MKNNNRERRWKRRRMKANKIRWRNKGGRSKKGKRRGRKRTEEEEEPEEEERVRDTPILRYRTVSEEKSDDGRTAITRTATTTTNCLSSKAVF